jgi:hypothetical protein
MSITKNVLHKNYHQAVLARVLEAVARALEAVARALEAVARPLEADARVPRTSPLLLP